MFESLDLREVNSHKTGIELIIIAYFSYEKLNQW
jgi:hypothetical protein